MDMIRHNYIIIHGNIRINLFGILNDFRNDFSYVRQRYLRRGEGTPPYDMRQQRCAVFRAERDKIHAFFGVIILFQADMFSLRAVFHSLFFSLPPAP